MKAVDAKTMRLIDALAMRDFGLRGLQLMENAGRGVSDIVRGLLPRGGSVAIVAGKGNNGGDGYVCARHLRNSGVPVTVFSLAGLKDLKGKGGDALLNARVWSEMGGETLLISSSRDLKKYASPLKHSSVIVDAIFGTGLSTPVKGVHSEVIDFINGLGKTVVSVDVPSGLDATTGKILGTSIKAAVTATMALPKLAFFLYPGRALAGRVEVVGIGVPWELLEDRGIRWNITGGEDLRRILKPRPGDSHKGTYGHVLVLSGSPGKTGAVYMTAMGAMRAGAGLTTIGLPQSLNAIMETKTTEVMTAPLPETAEKTLGVNSFDAIKGLLEGKTVVVTGPGLGVTPETTRLMERLIRSVPVPMVIDADALNSLSGKTSVLLKEKAAPSILTPHPGEAARLLGVEARSVQEDRIGAAGSLARDTDCVVLLKGACSVIAAPDGTIHINPTGNPGLSTAGTGDVLAGMIGGLLSQGYPPLDAAVAATYIHGMAADKLKKENGEAGLMATDLLDVVPGVLNSFVTGSGL